MDSHKFVIVQSALIDTSEVQRGPEIFYRCTTCNGVISSQPEDNIGCECGNIFIDIDYHRLAISRFDNFVVVRQVFS